MFFAKWRNRRAVLLRNDVGSTRGIFVSINPNQQRMRNVESFGDGQDPSDEVVPPPFDMAEQRALLLRLQGEKDEAGARYRQLECQKEEVEKELQEVRERFLQAMDAYYRVEKLVRDHERQQALARMRAEGEAYAREQVERIRNPVIVGYRYS